MEGGPESRKRFNDAFTAYSLRFPWRSPPFESLEGELAAHFLRGMVCDKEGMPREELETPRSLLFAWHSPVFEPHSLLFAPFELGGMGHEEQEMRLEGGGMALEELFAPPGVELAALSLPFGRLEGQGTRREAEGMKLERQRTRFEEQGMRLEEQGT